MKLQCSDRQEIALTVKININMETQAFGITALSDTAVSKQINKVSELKSMINKKLSIKDYSSLLNRFVFVFVAINPDNQFQENNFQKYRRKTKTLEVGVNVDYEKLLHAKDDEVLPLLKQTYLNGIKNQIKHKDFAAEKFYNDVENILMKPS